MSDALTREQLITEVENCDDILYPGKFSNSGKAILAHDAAQREKIARLERELLCQQEQLRQQLADAKAEIGELAEMVIGTDMSCPCISRRQYQRALELKRKATSSPRIPEGRTSAGSLG